MTGPGQPVAVISGGSSGIGLEIARLLRARGYLLHLIARDAARLEAAAEALGASPAAPVFLHAVDVAEEGAGAATIDAVLARHGRIDWLVTSAGMVEPGLFLDLPPASFRRQMAVNYFGTLDLVRPVAAHMVARGAGGRITLVSSAAAFTGIAGYAGYAPSKAALKALGEALNVELAPAGVQVSVAFPPDTDTPQYAAEQAAKPEATKRITAGGGVLSAPAVASAIVTGVEAGRFMLAPGLLMRLFALFHSLHAPLFLRAQKKILQALSRG